MSRKLLISCGPVHLRAVLCDGEQPIAFRAAPFDTGLFTGDRTQARVLSHPASTDGAIVQTEAGEGLLSHPKSETARAFAARLPEGKTLWAEVRTPARSAHRMRLVEADGPRDNHGWLGVLARSFPDAEIIIDAASHLPAARALWARVQHHTMARPVLADAEAEYQAALNPLRALPGQGTIRWRPTDAFHSFDVDAGANPRDKANILAATAIARMIFELGLEGLMAVGFIPLPAGAREAVRSNLVAALRSHGVNAQVERMDALGVLSLTVPRTGMALDDALLEPDSSGYGVRRKAGAIAAEACAMLASEQTAQPGTRLVLSLHPDVAAWLQTRQIAVHADPALPRDGYKITSDR